MSSPRVPPNREEPDADLSQLRFLTSFGDYAKALLHDVNATVHLDWKKVLNEFAPMPAPMLASKEESDDEFLEGYQKAKDVKNGIPEDSDVDNINDNTKDSSDDANEDASNADDASEDVSKTNEDVFEEKGDEQKEIDELEAHESFRERYEQKIGKLAIGDSSSIMSTKVVARAFEAYRRRCQMAHSRRCFSEKRKEIDRFFDEEAARMLAFLPKDRASEEAEWSAMIEYTRDKTKRKCQSLRLSDEAISRIDQRNQKRKRTIDARIGGLVSSLRESLGGMDEECACKHIHDIQDESKRRIEEANRS